jgi:hypothetical protein
MDHVYMSFHPAHSFTQMSMGRVPHVVGAVQAVVGAAPLPVDSPACSVANGGVRSLYGDLRLFLDLPPLQAAHVQICLKSL